VSSDEADCELLSARQATRSVNRRTLSPKCSLCVRSFTTARRRDVTQEVFLSVFRSLRRWMPPGRSMPWTHGIGSSLPDLAGQRARRPELVDYLQTPPESTPTTRPSWLREIRGRSMTAPDTDGFVLFHEHGQPYEEIAQALDGRSAPSNVVASGTAGVLERLQRRGMVPADGNPAYEEASLSRRQTAPQHDEERPEWDKRP